MLHDTLNGFPAEARVNGVTESFMLAMSILKYYFGENWLNRYVTPDTAIDNYLRIDESTQERKDLSALRVIDLAEVIFNVQGVEGFDGCIARMQQGEIEATFAELDLGRMLYLNQVPFRYITPSGVKGSDYDVEIAYSGELIACADAKCKIEKTDLSEATLLNTMRKARSQFPNDKPAIVFVKMPSRWMDEAGFAKIAEDAATKFLRNTQRVVSVKYYVSPFTIADGFLKQEHAYREFSNARTNFGNDVNWNVFQKFDLPPEMNGMPPHWQRILFFPDGKVR